jgi:hypothetical protein
VEAFQARSSEKTVAENTKNNNYILINLSLKGLSHEMDLAFDDMYGWF